ncbi:MAG: GAF domain-containing sensor histidine kinase [Chloroflexales bacterium]|nr:GAF domain-containing sensor histidine kinase [Chloroflexales bacterium]
MSRSLPPAPALARLLVMRQEAVVSAWAELVRQQPDTNYATLPLAEMLDTGRRSLAALAKAIDAGSLPLLDSYLHTIGPRRLQMGFSGGEIVEALLQTRAAALPSLLEGAPDLPAEQAVTLFDAYLHRAIGRFTTGYGELAAREVREQQQRTSLILEATQAAASALRLDEVLARIANTIAAAIHVPDCGIYLLDKGEGTLAPRFPTSAPDQHRLTAFLRHALDPLADPLIREAVECQRPVACSDVGRKPQVNHALAAELGVVAMLVLPLVANERVLGVAIAAAGEPHEFAAPEIELAWGIATSGALAVENVRLFEETRRRLAESQSLHRQVEQLAIVAERQRLSRDLHDSVAQSLYSLTLYAEAASGALADGEPATAAAHMGEVGAIARDLLGEMRLLIYNLRSPILDAEGLVGALQSRLDSVEAHAALQAELSAQGEDQLSPEVRQELYYIAQEALNNVIKHAHAARVRVRLRFGPMTLLEIDDDGLGFDLAAQARSGLGMQGMAERARRLRGALTIWSAPGQGTHIAVEVPV